jgi:K+ transporter
MRNIFVRSFPGSLSVQDAYGITIVITLFVITLLSVLNITNIVVTRCCEFVHIYS